MFFKSRDLLYVVDDFMFTGRFLLQRVPNHRKKLCLLPSPPQCEQQLSCNPPPSPSLRSYWCVLSSWGFGFILRSWNRVFEQSLWLVWRVYYVRLGASGHWQFPLHIGVWLATPGQHFLWSAPCVIQSWTFRRV